MRTWAYERKFDMPVKSLPSNPSLNHLKYQAKDLLKGHAARSLDVAQRIREFHPNFKTALDAEIFSAGFTLGSAQLTIAREHGFRSWARLKEHVEKPVLSHSLRLPHHERIEDSLFRRAVYLLDAGDAAGLRAHLKHHPDLVCQHVFFEGGNYFRNPTLLEFVAENPIRRGTLPANIVAVTETILEAGAERSALNEALGLICSGRVPRECRVQLPLIDLLCDHGADPDLAIETAVVHGEFEAVNALIRRGAQMNLPVAAALGNTEAVLPLLPGAGYVERHRAFALASQFGQVEIVRSLLDAGEDPNRYNPVGFHSHSTPIHQAALAGHDKLVRLLVERGARADLKDVLWQGTPADWAKHAGKTEVEVYLRAQERRKDEQE
jgi:Ankyrin repeats (3 copies)